MVSIQLFEWLEQRRHIIQRLMIVVLALLVVGVYALVYITGGIKYVYSHSMYIPILLSGFIFGIRGGMITGVLAGIVLGPFMPINVETGEAQATINWLYRTGFFTLIGAFSGIASDSVRSYVRHLRWLSQHDITTGLPNRNALLDSLSSLGKKKRPSSPFHLVVVAIENLMELKSAFGYPVIEEAIRQLATRFLENHIPRHVYHTDTAQIAILFDNDTQDLIPFIDRLAETARQPVLYDDIPIHIDIRMGHVTFSQVSDIPEHYLQKAEAALTRAYETVQESAAYSPAIIKQTEDNLSILGELQEALADGQLSLHYQPKVIFADGTVHGAEALMRWHHPERGNIPPGFFIPRAEQSTLIHLLTEFALDQAMGQMAQWRKAGIRIPIAVNISPQNLAQPGFTDQVLRLLNHHGLTGESLELEITERALMVDMDHIIDELARLADSKMVISIDDFGTGYSSLQYLHRLPASLIKIDQSFVRNLPSDNGAAHIVEAAVALAHKMNIRTIAEGVETKESYDFLQNLGCDIAQGFLISRPMPAKDFEKWYMELEGVYRAGS